MGRRRVLLLIRPFVANRRGGTATPKVTYVGLKGGRGLGRNAAGSSGSPGIGSSGASWGDAGTARGRPRLKVRKDAGAAPGTARKGTQVQQARQAIQSLPGQRCQPSRLCSLQSFQMPAADAGVHVSTLRTVCTTWVCLCAPCLSVFQRHLDNILYNMF